MGSEPLELAPIYAAVGQALENEREALNRADTQNGNHGDHMAAIFQVAEQTAQADPDAPLPAALREAGRRLQALQDNGSAQVYALGLSCMAEQMEKYQIDLSALAGYLQSALRAEGEKGSASPAQSGQVLKALAAGLAEWTRAAESADRTGEPGQQGSALNMGALFEFGMAYLQAKQRGGERTAVLADAAASVSPLGRVPHRYRSGKLAIQALLQAFLAQESI